MNQLLFDRLTGDLGPPAFGRIQTSQLLLAIQPAPRLLFDGGEQELVPSTSSAGALDPQKSEAEGKLWAHQAGVNALSIDIAGRMYSLAPKSWCICLLKSASFLAVLIP
jgi:DNA excision repair protein ERCC-8